MLRPLASLAEVRPVRERIHLTDGIDSEPDPWRVLSMELIAGS